MISKKRFILISILFFSLININYSYSIEPDIFIQSTVNRASELLSENITKEEINVIEDWFNKYNISSKKKIILVSIKKNHKIIFSVWDCENLN